MLDAGPRTGWPIPLDDPYPTLRRLREAGPVHRLPELECYLVVSYAEATAVLQGSEWSSDPTTSSRLATRLGVPAAARELVARSLLMSDPPGHTRLRRALSGHFTARTIEGLRGRIAGIVDSAFSSHEPGEALEVMDEIAYPVPLAVICELLDAGVDAAELLRRETPRMAAMLDPLAGSEAMEAGAAAAFTTMLELVPLVAERTNYPGGDLLSALVADMNGATVLDADEAIVMGLLLLAAGHETTANLIGNAVIDLRDHPDAARRLRGRPELLPTALEELLRYGSPIQLTSRVAKTDIRLGDLVVNEGEQVLVCLAAANRDGAVFPDPDRLDLARDARGHLALGRGGHFCAGAALARAEGQAVLGRLLTLDPPFEERSATVERGGSPTFRRVSKLVLEA